MDIPYQWNLDSGFFVLNFGAQHPGLTLPVSSDLPFCFEELIESLPDDSPANFKLPEVSHGEVLRVLKLLRSDTSTGPDGIPVKFVKMVADSIAGPLTAIINNCIRKYYFPKVWKNARISPFPKVDQPKSEEHFRLISILPTLLKVFEKLIALRMTTFVNLNQCSAIQFLAFVRDTRPIQC